MAKATLFSFNVYLRQDGNIELDKQSVRPDELQRNGRWSARLRRRTLQRPF